MRGVALFNHDSDPDVDTKLLRYLRTGILDLSATATPADVGPQENERLLQQVRANQAEIRRLLELRCQTSEPAATSDPTRTGGDC